VTNSNGLLIEIQRAMMQSARRVILCVDHTKFGRQSISELCTLDAIDTLITNELPAPDMQTALAKAGVELILAASEGPKVILQTRPKAPRPHQRKPLPAPASAGISTEHDGFID
jgi:hypothetical protein